jgi:hypothetical protein
MEGSTEYRKIGYSITDLGNGKWQWKLHPKKEADAMTPIISGEISGTHDEAVAAAKKEIDTLIGQNSL